MREAMHKQCLQYPLNIVECPAHHGNTGRTEETGTLVIYSGTSLNRYLPIAAATLLTQPFDVVPIQASLIQYLQKLSNVETLLFASQI